MNKDKNNKDIRILVFDNYDSFTYNIVHAVRSLGYTSIDVFRNDAIALDAVEAYDKIILSPGPGIPEEAGLLLPLIKRYAATKSILGICLGHQAIAEAFGGKLVNLSNVYHGVATPLVADEDILFKGLPASFEVGRYHSWAVQKEGFPQELKITALSLDGEIMALAHKTYDVRGVQFHPESVLTPNGLQLIQNFLEYRHH